MTLDAETIMTLHVKCDKIMDVKNDGKININGKNKIKTIPRFQADSTGKYSWLNDGVYAASLEGGEKGGEVEITIYKMN